MLNYGYISIKSKIGVEFRRYTLNYDDTINFDTFYHKIEAFHHLENIPFVIYYTDTDDFPLPINNDDNLAKAIHSAKHIYLTNINHRNNNYYPALMRRPYLRIFIERKGDLLDGTISRRYKKGQNFKGLTNLISSSASYEPNPQRLSIGMPEDFRCVSSIIDVDSVPRTCRRVRISKHGETDKPLGFWIRDGTYKRMNSQGQVELVTGFFISKLVAGGLAESTGLLAVNDEVLEVNGVQVRQGKTLDQVSDMMVANSSNLIMTIRPGRMNYVS